MRDNKTMNGQVPWKKWRSNLPQYPQSGTTTHTFSRTQRSDITVQPYIKGFRYPTDYASFHGTCKGYPYHYRSYTFSTVWEYEGTSSAGKHGGGNLYGFGTYNVAQRTPIVSTNTKNRVYTEAAAKLQQGDLQLGVMIAEGRRSFNLVVDSVYVVLKAFHYVRRRQYYEALNILGLDPRLWRKYRYLTPARFWLSIKYGWMPLLQDIYALIDALNTDWSKYPPTLSVVRRLAWDHPGVPEGANRMEGRVKMGCECKLYYRINDETLYFLSSIGLTNPAIISWELVPFSFVFDWFVPVGTWLQALSASHMGIQQIGGYRTSYANAAFKAYYSEGYPIGTASLIDGTEECLEVRYRSMRRERIVGALVPIPFVKWGYSTSHAISAIALILSGKGYHQ